MRDEGGALDAGRIEQKRLAVRLEPAKRASIRSRISRQTGRPRPFILVSVQMASNVAQASTRLILIGAAVLLSIGMGLRQSIGLFLTPVTRDLALTAADFTLTIAIQNIVWGLAQAPAGAIADRFGLRLTLVTGIVIYIAGLAVMAAAGGEMALIVSSVLIGIALACTASSLALAACARAVPEQSRSKMLGVVAAVGSFGTFIVPLATQGVLKYYPPGKSGRCSLRSSPPRCCRPPSGPVRRTSFR